MRVFRKFHKAIANDLTSLELPPQIILDHPWNGLEVGRKNLHVKVIFWKSRDNRVFSPCSALKEHISEDLLARIWQSGPRMIVFCTMIG